VIDLVTNELIQVKECENHNFYNYDVDKTLLNPIAKNLTFYKEKRFTNKGIFGDLYDPNKKVKFGSSGESMLDADKVERGMKTMIKPRITEQKSFDAYVARDCSVMEATIGTKLVCNIPTDEELKLMSIKNLKAYKRLVEEKKPLPVLDKVNHQDYLPNTIKRKNRKAFGI